MPFPLELRHSGGFSSELLSADSNARRPSQSHSKGLLSGVSPLELLCRTAVAVSERHDPAKIFSAFDYFWTDERRRAALLVLPDSLVFYALKPHLHLSMDAESVSATVFSRRILVLQS